MTYFLLSIIMKPMKKLNFLYKYLKSKIHILVSLLITLLIVYSVDNMRNVLLLSYKLTNMLSLSLLVLCIINVFLVYKDNESKTKTLFFENISAIIYFIGYIACKLLLRG